MRLFNQSRSAEKQIKTNPNYFRHSTENRPKRFPHWSFISVFRLLTDTYPKCKEISYECFVLDGAGFLIMHKDFLSPDITARNLEYVHITAKEKDISEDLLKKGHLIKRQCRNMEKIDMENFYELKIPPQGVNTLTTGQRCRKYQLSRVGGSNAVLGKGLF